VTAHIALGTYRGNISAVMSAAMVCNCMGSVIAVIRSVRLPARRRPAISGGSARPVTSAPRTALPDLWMAPAPR
jgi:hypothetical protein